MENQVSHCNLLPLAVSPPKFRSAIQVDKMTDSRQPCSSRDSKNPFHDIQNLPHSAEIDRDHEVAQSAMTGLLKTQIKPSSNIYAHFSSPTSSGLVRSARLSADVTPVVIRCNEKISSLVVTTANNGLSRLRAKASVERICRSVSWGSEQPLSPERHCSQSFPSKYSHHVDSEIFYPPERLSTSSSSLATLPGNLFGKSNTRENDHNFKTARGINATNLYLASLHCNESVLDTDNIRFPLPIVGSTPPKLCRRPALTRPTGYGASPRKLPSPAAGACNKDYLLLTKSEYLGGFPTDMLDTLSNLETLASRVKMLEKPFHIIPQTIEDVLPWRKPIGKEHIENVRSAGDVKPKWSRVEKEKWRALDSHRVVNNFTQISVVSLSSL